MNALNHQFRLAARPVGLPTAADWTHAEEPVPEPAEGQVPGFELAVTVDARAGQHRKALLLPIRCPIRALRRPSVPGHLAKSDATEPGPGEVGRCCTSHHR
jgi:hypothetical protein